MHVLARAAFLLLLTGSAVGAGTVQQHADPDPPVAPAQPWQIGIYLITAFCLLLAAAGGIGAVAMLVTFYMVIGGPQHVPAGMAVGMISCVLAGSGIVHVSYYSTQRHPVFKDRSLIDPNLLILITSPGIAGVALGGLANRVAPVWVVYVCLALVMIGVSYSLTCKALEAHRSHQAAVQVKRAAAVALSRSFVACRSCSPVAAGADAIAAAAVAAAEASSAKTRAKWQAAVRKLSDAGLSAVPEEQQQQQDDLQQQQQQQVQPQVVVVQGCVKEEAGDADFFAVDASERGQLSFRQPPIVQQCSKFQSFSRWESFLVMQTKDPLQKWRKKHFALAAVMIAAAALPGTAALAHCGSGLWFLAVLSGLPLLLLVVAFTGTWLAVYVRNTERQQQRRKAAVAAGRYAPDMPAQHWTTTRLTAVPCACLVAGSLNGFIGTGGAFILARIALAVDTHPAAMAATLQSSVIGWAASGLGIYGLLGQVPWGMGGVLMMIAAVSTALGHATVSQYIKRTGKFWMILAIVAACAAVSAALAVYNMVVVMLIVAKRPALWTATGTMCHKVTL